MESTNYPKELFKYRSCEGVAEYRQIDGNLYEDTTCRHSGDNCRITVIKVDDHYELDSLMNESAIAYEDYHAKGGSDSHYYDSFERCMLFPLNQQIERYTDNLSNLTSSFADILKLLSTSIGTSIPVSISTLDYNDTIYIHSVGHTPYKYLHDSDVVVEKVFNKDGLVSINTQYGYKVESRNNLPFYLVRVEIPTDDGIELITCIGFTDKVIYNTFINSRDCCNSAQKLVSMISDIDSYTISISQLENEVAKYRSQLASK